MALHGLGEHSVNREGSWECHFPTLPYRTNFLLPSDKQQTEEEGRSCCHSLGPGMYWIWHGHSNFGNTRHGLLHFCTKPHILSLKEATINFVQNINTFPPFINTWISEVIQPCKESFEVHNQWISPPSGAGTGTGSSCEVLRQSSSFQLREFIPLRSTKQERNPILEMNHSKMCPFFSSQAWAASHKVPGHRLLIWQGSAQQQGRGILLRWRIWLVRRLFRNMAIAHVNAWLPALIC